MSKFNKAISFLFSLTLFALVFSFCNKKIQNLQYTQKQEKFEEYDSTAIVEDEPLEDNSKVGSNDSTAIANIHFNTTKDVFEQEKRIFLLETKQLGNLVIKSVNGFFYNDRLSALQIISNGRRGKIDYKSGWADLYREKYESDIADFLTFGCTVGCKRIYVSDWCSSCNPYTSFEDLIDKPVPHFKEKENTISEFQPIDFSSMDMIHALSTAQRIEKYLSKSSLRRYTDLITSRDDEYNTGIQKAYNHYRQEANAEIRRRNSVIDKHNEQIEVRNKNALSYSIILIVYKPAEKEYEAYKNNKESEQSNRRYEQRQKDLDKI